LRGGTLADATLEEMEAAWQAAKRGESSASGKKCERSPPR
jgi:hypothetical protein